MRSQVFIFRTKQKWQLWSLWRFTFHVPGMLHYATLFIINVSLFCLATRCADDNSFTHGKLCDNGKRENHFISHSIECNLHVGVCKNSQQWLETLRQVYFPGNYCFFVCLLAWKEKEKERNEFVIKHNRIQKMHMANYMHTRQGSAGLKEEFCLLWEGSLSLSFQCGKQTLEKIM